MTFLNAPLQEGFIILAIGMGIVFLSLLLLFLVFQYGVPAFINNFIKRNRKKYEQESVQRQPLSSGSGEEMAAVCTAVYMMLAEVHDRENAIITISQSAKVYSPWSSKIYVTHKVR